MSETINKLMDKLILIKRTQTDVVNKRFKYLCQTGRKQVWFPWSIAGHTFPERYPIGSIISVSYYGDDPSTIDWVGSIKS